MTCPDDENLTAFADGELNVADSAAIDQHLRECSACAELVSDMRRLDDIGRNSLRQIRVTTSPPQVRLRTSRLRVVAAIAAVLLLAIAGAGWHMMSDRGSPVTNTAVAPPDPPRAEVETTPPMIFSDEEFEQWAAPHRRRRISLVPMEQVATFHAPPVLPFLPTEPSSTERLQ